MFAASTKLGEGAQDAMRSFASHYGLELIGYTDGTFVLIGGGEIFNEGEYALE